LVIEGGLNKVTHNVLNFAVAVADLNRNIKPKYSAPYIANQMLSAPFFNWQLKGVRILFMYPSTASLNLWLPAYSIKKYITFLFAIVY